MGHAVKLAVEYYAILRDQRGLGQEEIETRATTARELYRFLAEQHGFTLKPSSLRAAVNDEFVSMDDPLHDGDCVAFIPPVAGG